MFQIFQDLLSLVRRANQVPVGHATIYDLCVIVTLCLIIWTTGGLVLTFLPRYQTMAQLERVLRWWSCVFPVLLPVLAAVAIWL